MRTPGRLLIAGATLALALAGCSLTDDLDDSSTDPADAVTTDVDTAEPSDAEEAPLVAIITTTPLGSVVDQIAQCAGATTETIMGIGDDPHSFQPSSEQVAQMVNAPLVVVSGLGLEESLLSAVESAQADGATVLELGPLVDPLTFGETGGSSEHSHEDEDGHEDDDDGHGHDDDEDAHEDEAHDEDDDTLDPHWWLDVSRMATAAGIVGDTLAEETGDPEFATCGEEISAELTELDLELAGTDYLASVGDDDRKLVTDHLAFGYFAQRYGFEMVGAVIPSISTDAEASSADLAELVHTIEELQIPAIFTNVVSPNSLADAVAAEVGFDVEVVSLFTESLGPEGSGAETYQEMMRTNANLIANALSPTETN